MKKIIYIDKNQNNKFYDYNPIDTKHYYPKFIKEMNDQQMKEFSNALNNKIRRVKLTMAKLQIDAARYKNYEKEEKKKDRNISLKHELKILFGKSIEKKEFNSPRMEQMNTERAYNFGIIKTYKNIGERFDNFKSDFDMKIRDLKNSFENKLLKNYMILTKNKKNKNSQNTKNKSPININRIIDGYKTTTSNNNLLPNINNRNNNFNKDIKEVEKTSINKKKVNFNKNEKGNMTYREQNNKNNI